MVDLCDNIYNICKGIWQIALLYIFLTWTFVESFAQEKKSFEKSLKYFWKSCEKCLSKGLTILQISGFS